jgi:hypothetical protein
MSSRQPTPKAAWPSEVDSNRLEVRLDKSQEVFFGFQRSSGSTWHMGNLAVPSDVLLRSSRWLNPKLENERLRIRIHLFTSGGMIA